jgi:Restriction endonuclease S subunits
MELKPGFKQTEVGVIPEDWDVKLLPDVLRFRSGKAHEQFISDTGSYICVNSKFISTGGSVRKYSSANFSPARKGDVLMVMSDLPNGRALAKAYFVEADNIYAVNQRVCALTAYRDNPKYLFYILNRNPYFLSFDDGVSQTHLLNRVFQKCPIPLPQSTKEQSSIAEALSVVDSLLYDLDQLVIKKRAIKQAVMQELLTGKRRLPGFEGEWEVKRLGEIATIDPENLGSNTQPDYRFNYISLEDVDQGSLLHWSEQEFSSAPSRARRRLRLNDVLVSTVRPSLKSHLLFSQDNSEWVCSTGFSTLRCNGDLADPSYVYFHLFGDLINKQIESLLTGSNYPAISSRDVRSLEIPVPALPEQREIASILRSMEEEVCSLTERLEKTFALKQGMMQQLLTGKIRLT